MMEKCLVKMIEFDVDKSTPPRQIGSVKNHKKIPEEKQLLVVVDTLGQGTSLAPKGVGLTVGKTVDIAIPAENNDQV